jgi:prophage regulatory protein
MSTDTHAPAASRGERLLRLPAVLDRVPVSRSTWYAGIASGKFPAPVKLGERVAAWRESEVNALIDGLGQPQAAA